MLPETVSAWKSLEGRVIDGTLRLDALDSHERVPVFSAHLEGRPVTVRFFHESDGSTAVFNRHREAAYLSHPCLLPCLGTGTVSLQEGERFTYGVYEAPNLLLAALLEAKTFTPEEVRTLCLDILDGLEFLHTRGLVYGNLDRTTVARCGDRWKLCDYSELRPEGFGYAEETRRLLGVLPGAPPEAFSGVVSPAWDTWSLAHLLRSLVAAPPAARHPDGTPVRPPRAPELPEPFRSIAAACLLPDPGARCRIADIRRQLEESIVEQSPAAAEPLPQVPQPQSVAGPDLLHTAPPPSAAPALTPLAPDVAAVAADPEHHPAAASADTPWDRVTHAPPDPESRPAPAAAGTPWDRVSPTHAAAPDPEHHPAAATVAGTPWDRLPPTRRVTPAAMLVGAATAIGLLLAVSGYITQHDTTSHPDEPAIAQTAEPTRSRTAPEPATAQAEVDRLVNKWADAFRNRDLETELSLYAPRVRRFYLANNVTPDFIRRTKQSALRSAGKIRRYDIENVNTRFDSPDKATVTFDKSWDFAGGRRPTGKVKSELKLERQNGDWRIVSERDLQVYNQTRSRT